MSLNGYVESWRAGLSHVCNWFRNMELGMPAVEMNTKLNPESVRGWLNARQGWKRRSNRLMKNFKFTNFRDSIVFVNRVATLADSHKHHPDIDVRDATVTLMLSTEDAGGITEKDLDLAEQIDFATSFGDQH